MHGLTRVSKHPDDAPSAGDFSGARGRIEGRCGGSDGGCHPLSRKLLLGNTGATRLAASNSISFSQRIDKPRAKRRSSGPRDLSLPRSQQYVSTSSGKIRCPFNPKEGFLSTRAFTFSPCPVPLDWLVPSGQAHAEGQGVAALIPSRRDCALLGREAGGRAGHRAA